MSGCIPGSRHRCLFSVTTEWICFQNCPKVSLNAETQSRTVVTGLAAFYLVSRLQNRSLPTFLQGDWAVRCSHVFMLYLAFPYNEHQVRKTIQVSQFRRMLAWIRLTNQKLDITVVIWCDTKMPISALLRLQLVKLCSELHEVTVWHPNKYQAWGK